MHTITQIQTILHKPSFKNEYWKKIGNEPAKKISVAAWFKLYDLPETKVLAPLTIETN